MVISFSAGFSYSVLMWPRFAVWMRSQVCIQRPYLINFDATGSPCHELTSWDNSNSMSI